MALIYCIRNLISLLAIPENKIADKRFDAIKIVQIANNYVCSPTFILFGGYWLKKKVSKKFSIENNISKKNVAMALPTALFSDEIIMVITLIVLLVLMDNIWLVNWKTESATIAYNHIHTKDALELSCYHSPDQQCSPCNQVIMGQLDNNTNKYIIRSGGGCNDVIGVYCPLIEKNGIKAVTVAFETKQNGYADPNSFVNDTYMVYTISGFWSDSGRMKWNGIICNRTIQAEYAMNNVISKWKMFSALIVIGCVLFYITISSILHRVHNCMVDLGSFVSEEELLITSPYISAKSTEPPSYEDSHYSINHSYDMPWYNTPPKFLLANNLGASSNMQPYYVIHHP
jgi:hypothetical protein